MSNQVFYPDSAKLSGLASTGCTNLDPDTPSTTNVVGRRKRAIQAQSACSSLSSVTTSSSDPTMTSSVLSNMCNYAVQQTGNSEMASAAKSAISALTNVRSADIQSFGNAASSTTLFAPFAYFLLAFFITLFIRSIV